MTRLDGDHDGSDDRSLADRADGGEADAGGSGEFLGELDGPPPAEIDLTPEAAVVESLNSALKQLRTDADDLESMPLDATRVDAAEQLAEDAARLDEQIGSIARNDEA